MGPNMSMSIHTIEESYPDQGEGINTGEAGVKDKQQKVLVVAEANAIIHPRAMVCSIWKKKRLV